MRGLKKKPLMKMNFPNFIFKKKRSSVVKEWEPLMLLAELACQERDKLLLLLHHHPNPNNEVIKVAEQEEEKTTSSGTKKRKKMMGDNHSVQEKTIQFKKAKSTGDPEPAPHCSVEAHYRQMVSTNDSGLIHVCQKSLTKTDVDGGQNRLLLPTKHVHERLLPALGYSLEDEKDVLKTPGIAVIGLDPDGRAWNLRWKFWTKYHVLDGQWKNLVDVNGLKAGLHSIHVTAFCYGEGNRDICFVISSRSGSNSASASASASTAQDQLKIAG